MNKRFVICVESDGYPASMEKQKLYELVPDQEAERHGQLRVKDESGDDYLNPRELFVFVELPSDVEFL